MPKLVAAAGALAFLLAAAPSDRVPRLDLRETCRGTTPGDAGAGTACRRDEEAARRELGTRWPTIPVSVRRSCLDEVRIGGTPSYVELLTCAEMDEWSRQEPNPTALGAVTRGGTRP